jgi:hypothetical protein
MMIGTGVQGSQWVKGSKKNADWTFSLGNEFQAKYWDGNEHKVFSGGSAQYNLAPSTDFVQIRCKERSTDGKA